MINECNTWGNDEQVFVSSTAKQVVRIDETSENKVFKERKSLSRSAKQSNNKEMEKNRRELIAQSQMMREDKWKSKT